MEWHHWCCLVVSGTGTLVVDHLDPVDCQVEPLLIKLVLAHTWMLSGNVLQKESITLTFLWRSGQWLKLVDMQPSRRLQATCQSTRSWTYSVLTGSRWLTCCFKVKNVYEGHCSFQTFTLSLLCMCINVTHIIYTSPTRAHMFMFHSKPSPKTPAEPSAYFTPNSNISPLWYVISSPCMASFFLLLIFEFYIFTYSFFSCITFTNSGHYFFQNGSGSMETNNKNSSKHIKSLYLISVWIYGHF